MATHDYVIANGTGAAVRSDLNDALAAIVSNNSGSSEPATTYAYQWWADTTANVLKIRNSANNAWITLRELDGTMLIEDGSASTPGLAFADDVNTGIFSPAADQIGFATGGAERLEIGSSEVVFNDPSNDVDFRVESNGKTHMLFVDAGNDAVGIGTDSPATDLDVASNTGGVIRLTSKNTSAVANENIGKIEYFTNDADGAHVGAYVQAIQDPGDAFGRATALTFATNNTSASVTEVVRFDRLGRVGIGTTTPGAYSTSADELVVAGTTNPGITIAGSSGNTGTIMFADGTSGSEVYRGQIDYQHASDVMVFFTNGGSEALRIDSSQRLLVGTSSAPPANTADVVVKGGTGSGGAGGLTITRTNTTPADGNSLGNVHFADSSAEPAATIQAQRDGGTWTSTSSQPTRLIFQTAANGASSPTRRARITSTGLFGATTIDGFRDLGEHEFVGNTNGKNVLAVQSNAENNNQYVLLLRTVNDQNDATRTFMQAYGNATVRFEVRSNGGIANYQSNNANLCDEREKKNIVNLDTKWDKVKSWELKKFHYNEEADTDDLRYGVIAQQIEEHTPEVLTDWIKQRAEDAVLDEDGNVVTPAVPEITRKGVKEQQMMWMAIKALQEAMDRIETLETKVAALEAQ